MKKITPITLEMVTFGGIFALKLVGWCLVFLKTEERMEGVSLQHFDRSFGSCDSQM